MIKKLKAYIKHFIPPIFYPEYFREIKNRVINKKKLHINLNMKKIFIIEMHL